MKHDLLVVHEVARLASPPVAAQTARRWADSGRIPVLRTGGGMRLFRRLDVLKFLSARAEARARLAAERAQRKGGA